jgi:hypothetical protein
MFGFGKKKKTEQQREKENGKKTKVDKLVMGAIIGVAVGSVVGMTIAPQKGSDTRKMIADKGKEAINKGREFGVRIAGEKKKRKGLLRRMVGWFFTREKGGKGTLRKIPREQPADTADADR